MHGVTSAAEAELEKADNARLKACSTLKKGPVVVGLGLLQTFEDLGFPQVFDI